MMTEFFNFEMNCSFKFLWHCISQQLCMGFVTTIFRHMLEAWPLCLPLQLAPTSLTSYTPNQSALLFIHLKVYKVSHLSQDSGHSTAQQNLSSLRALYLYSSCDVFHNLVTW